ncbi:MAG TPA: hypothetical protein VFS57_06110, partial [Gemmatimonadaceae bacterium]|nr:hypothetical protein [Gemmatimonadaceae bacterium]
MTAAASTPVKSAESSVVAHFAEIDTAIGDMVAAATETHLLLLEFAHRRTLDRQLEHATRATGARFEPGDSPILDQLRTELAEYLAGQRCAFDVPLR